MKEIRKELLDELLEDYEKPEDLLGDEGLLKSLQKAFSCCGHPIATAPARLFPWRRPRPAPLKPFQYLIWSSPGLVDTFHLMKESVFDAENADRVPCGIQGADCCAGESWAQC